MKLNLELIKDGDFWKILEPECREAGFDCEIIKSALDYAVTAHYGQFRKSGEPYIVHPVWIARVTAELGIGQEAVIAALLHDCVEDTSVTIDDISNKFGDEVALLVEGLTEVKKKTSGIEMHQTNVEVFRQFLFSSVNDVRVLIIRLIDKLHNGLTIDSLPEENRVKYAKRVFGIYSPIAEYVGLHYFKRLLDDIAFKILYPKEAEDLGNIIKKNSKEEIRAKNIIKNDLEHMLKVNRLHDFEIQTRIKSLYSSYQKVQHYGTDRGFKDRVGLRVLVNTIPECYTVLGLIHSKYPYIEKEFKDYISSPKTNGYRSIQTTFVWKDNVSVEVQIRTKEMHEFNEFGPASHIAYKLGTNASSGIGFEWVKDLVKWQKSADNVNNYRINVLENFIYVFTPKGDTIQLKKGATGLDFAYRIHQEVGNHCVGIKINQKMAKIDDELKTGDMVEVLTSKKVQRNRNSLK